MKKVIGFLAVVVVLFVLLFVLTNMQQAKKTEGNPYEKNKLHPETVELLDNPVYDNIITPDKLNEKINNKESVTVYYFSPLCGYCMETTPIVKPIVEKLNIDLYKFNVLEFEHGWADYNLESTPTIIHYEDGQEVARISGKHDEETFEQWLNEFVK